MNLKSEITIPFLALAASVALISLGRLSRAQNSPEAPVRFYYAITEHGAYELAGFSNVGDFSRWFHGTQWQRTNESLFVICVPQRLDDIEVPFWSHGKLLEKNQARVQAAFIADNYIIPKTTAALVLERKLSFALSTNDLLPELVHVIGPDGKTFLNVHSDTVGRRGLNP